MTNHVRGIFDSIMRIITILTMIGLLGSYSAPFIDPNIFYIFSLLGLAYHYILIINILLLLYWIIRWKKIVFVSLFVILAGCPLIMTYYGLNSKSVPNESYDLSVMVYNIRQLDVYGWSKKEDTPTRIIDYINNSQEDVVCMEEFPNRDASLLKFTNYPYSHRNRDVAFISRYPIINKGIIAFDKGHSASCIFDDIIVKTDTIRVYTIHLESYRLGTNEQKMYKELTRGNTQNVKQGVRLISSRLINANKNRAIQAILIKAHMNKSPYPVILGGDFNDTPISFTYNIIDRDMKDSFIEKGHGLGNTYIGEFPSFRIDHILHSPEFETISYVRDSVTYSDHYPIRSKIRFRKRI